MSQGVLDSVLTPEEREWAFALEEALYGADDKTGIGGGRVRMNMNANANANANGGRRAFRRRRDASMNGGNSRGGGSSNNRTWNQVSINKTMPTDFELAAHAMIAKGDTARALKRIHRLAVFKQTYRVPDFESDLFDDNDNNNNNNNNDGDSDDDDDDDNDGTNLPRSSFHKTNNPQKNNNKNSGGGGGGSETNIEAVLLVLKKFLLAYPEFLKSVGLDKHGRVAVVIRLRGLRWAAPPPFNHTESDRCKALYCLLHALQPTPESVRRGTVWIGDLGGVSDRPAGPFLECCRKLLRDSYPLRVQDIPVVRCPPVWSGAFLGTKLYWSRHFGTKFVRVDPATLRKHFPSDLLAGRTKNSHSHSKSLNTPNGYGRPLHKRKGYQQRHQHQHQQKYGHGLGRQNRNINQKVVVAANGDDYDNDWENLDDEDSDAEGYSDDNDNSNSHSYSDWSSLGGDGGGSLGIAIATAMGTPEATTGAATTTATARANMNEELWNKLERLVRMRFETERTFRVA